MMEAKAIEAERQISVSPTKEKALTNAIAAAEFYMNAMNLASNESDRARLKANCMGVLAEAEKIKKVNEWSPGSTREATAKAGSVSRIPFSTRALSTREQMILLQGSKLHGLIFPEWTAKPIDSFFDIIDGNLYEDSSDIRLSNSQRKVFAGWKRPGDVFKRQCRAGDAEENLCEPTMMASQSIDLVQDVTADCSVVASLCAAVARTGDGLEKLMCSIVYPYDERNQRPVVSRNGRYVFRLHFNGCFRKVVIDDRLPDSISDRTLHVIDRRNPGLLWPALIEKAYLKVRGGYDFPGSNSGTDLWVLTGWIPEQIFLQSDEIQPQELWNRISKAYTFGDVVITVGTGRLSQREEEGLGLAGEHDYAVLAMKETGEQRLMLVKNPWCNGTVWKSANSNISDGHDAGVRDYAMESVDLKVLATSPGTFWITFDEIIQNFESLYLNWNPELFRDRQDHHFSWTIPPVISESCFAHNPQYSIRSKTGGPVWLLLSRHFSTVESELLRQSSDGGSASPSPLGFISLYVFRTDGERVFLSDDAFLRGPFVDSPQTLSRLEAQPGKSYTIIVAHQSLPLPKYSFTLSTFSRAPIDVGPATNPYPYVGTLSGAWTSRTAGGSSNAITYPSNPQFSISIPAPTDLAVLLETDRLDLAIHIDLVWANGERVTAITAKDIVGGSGEYRRGCALARIPTVPAGTFTIVCSTFEPGQTGSFTLRVESMSLCEIRPVAPEAAGRFSSRLPMLVLNQGVDRMLAPVTVSRMTRLRVVATHRSAGNAGGPKARSALRLSIERGQGPHKTVLSTSGDGSFSDAPAGVRIPDVDMSPQTGRLGGIWLVVERFVGRGVTDEIDVEVLSDLSVEIGAWGTGDG